MENINCILSKSVEELDRVGTARLKSLNSLGIYKLRDLLYYFPRRYEDRHIKKLVSAEISQTCAVLMRVARRPSPMSGKGRKIIKFRADEVEYDPETHVFDPTGISCDVVFFNSPYLLRAFEIGSVYIFYGRLSGNFSKFEMINPFYEPFDPAKEQSTLRPVYKKNNAVTQKYIRTITADVLKLIDGREDELEIIPEQIRRQYSLCHIGFALSAIHNPKSDVDVAAARARLIFEEIFIYTAALQKLKNRRRAEPGCNYTVKPDMNEFFSLLPFKFTKAQQRTADEILCDLGRGGLPMNRLVQGDVGSGKTVIAAAAAFYACKNGTQAVMIAPTDILAVQHYETLAPLFEKAGLSVCLLTGSLRSKAKREVIAGIKNGETDFIIGTHAVIQKGVEFKNLTLSITDEQHRFGVAQRASFNKMTQFTPHTLVMSATPIPRTLSLILYGDLDISVIDELPPGRQKVDTFALNSEYRPRIHKFIRKLISEGGLVFIVCPLIGDDESDSAPAALGANHPDAENSGGLRELKSVKSYFAELSEQIFPNIPMGFMHSRMKTTEKDSVMESFKCGEIKILVSTVVIEVGVNIPDAVLMVVENAERFGLSQLHQLRGRVGRGNKKSYCVLFSDNQNETVKKRLEIMSQTNDGFKIAQCDMEIRGPGNLLGEEQSGAVKFKMADLATDSRLLHDAANAAKSISAADPELAHPANALLSKAVSNALSGKDSGIAFN